MSIAGGVHRAIERSRSISCTAMQIFVKNNMQWFARPLTREEINAFLNHAQRTELGSVFAHANYLINLAATNPTFHANSLRALSEELVRADQLEIPFIVLHPGAHLGVGEKRASKKLSRRLTRFLPACQKLKRASRSKRQLARVPVSERNSNISPTSSAVCESRNDFAFASIPHTFSPRVTKSTTRNQREGCSPSSIA